MINIGGSIDMIIKVPNITFSKNDLLRDRLNKHFTNVVYNTDFQRYHGHNLIEFLKDADAAIVGLEKINEDILRHLPKLKLISKYGVGLDNINLNHAKKYGIKIGWTEGLNKQSVAEVTLGLILGLIRNLYLTSNKLKKNEWFKDGGFELHKNRIGIIGLGNVGQKLVELLNPFNCEIYVNDIKNHDSFIKSNKLIPVSKEEIYSTCKIITIHTPLTRLTHNLFNKETFKKMRSDSVIINTARGGIINESDLIWAIKNNQIWGGAIDVYDNEPPNNISLFQHDRLICTPHLAGNSKEAVLNMGMSAINHLVEYKKSI